MFICLNKNSLKSESHSSTRRNLFAWRICFQSRECDGRWYARPRLIKWTERPLGRLRCKLVVYWGLVPSFFSFLSWPSPLVPNGVSLTSGNKKIQNSNNSYFYLDLKVLRNNHIDTNSKITRKVPSNAALSRLLKCSFTNELLPFWADTVLH